MVRRSYAGGGASTTVASTISAGATVGNVVAAPSWPDGSGGPFAIAIGRGTPNEEKVLVTSRTSTTLNFAARGYDGTTAKVHGSGESVELIITAIDVDEANAHVNATTGVHGLPVGVKPVGESGAQTLTQKILSGLSNTFSNIPVSAIVGLADALTDRWTKADADFRYVNVSGDTITGNLTVNGAIATVNVGAHDINLRDLQYPLIAWNSTSQAERGPAWAYYDGYDWKVRFPSFNGADKYPFDVHANGARIRGGLEVTGAVSATGAVQSSYHVSTGDVHANNSVTADSDIIAADEVRGAYLHSLGAADADGPVHSYSGVSNLAALDVPGNLGVGGLTSLGVLLVAGAVTISNNATVTGTLGAGQLYTPNDVTAGHDVIVGAAVSISGHYTKNPPWASASGRNSLLLGIGDADAGPLFVAFPGGRFNVNPNVVATCESSGSVFATVGSVSTSGFNLYVHRTGGTSTSVSISVHWEAVQMNAGSANG